MADLPVGVQRDYPLARLPAIRTGGDARLFARLGTIAELEALLACGAERAIEVGVVGSGSNLLITDTGVRGLALKLDQQLSQITVQRTRIERGGGARLPAVSAQRSRS